MTNILKNRLGVWLSLVFFITISLSSIPQTIAQQDSVDIIEVRVYPNTTITPWDQITVFANVSNPKNVKNVTLYYAENIDPNLNPFLYKYERIQMSPQDTPLENARFGTWVKAIPKQRNGTFVNFYVTAFDKRNADHNSGLNHIFIGFPRSPTINYIVLQLKNIDPNFIYPHADIILKIQADLPSPSEPFSIDGSVSDPEYHNFRFDLLPTGTRFHYEATQEGKVRLIGDVSNYPYDKYLINMTIEIQRFNASTSSLNLNSLKLRTADEAVGLRNSWSITQLKGEPINDGNATAVRLVYLIERIQPFFYLPFWVFWVGLLLLGSTLLLHPREFQHRLSIYLSVMILTLTVLRISDLNPFGTKYTYIESLFFSLLILTAIFIILSIFAYQLSVSKRFQSDTLKTTIDGVTIIITELFVMVGVVFPKVMPTLELILTIFPLLIGIIGVMSRLRITKRYYSEELALEY